MSDEAIDYEARIKLGFENAWADWAGKNKYEGDRYPNWVVFSDAPEEQKKRMYAMFEWAYRRGIEDA